MNSKAGVALIGVVVAVLLGSFAWRSAAPKAPEPSSHAASIRSSIESIRNSTTMPPDAKARSVAELVQKAQQDPSISASDKESLSKYVS
ncbi:MAG TPA: hypothetical protein VF681_05650 [Abditibacteriaceae bacterium]